MAGYLGTKAVLLSTTAADVIGNAEIGGSLTVDGNVGIGTSSPSALLDVMSASNPSVKVRSNGGVLGNYAELTLQSYNNFSGSGQAFVRGESSASGNSNTDLVFGTNASGFGSPAEAMRIGSNGDINLGPTGAVGGVTVIPNYSAGSGLLYWNRTDTTATSTALRFDNQGVVKGSITYNNSSTAYNTSSDYRLKTDAQPMTGASARVQALKPVNFAWKDGGHRVDGFLAHEAQEVVPEAVTGTKDAMRDEEYEVTPAVLDDDGNVVTEAVMGTRSVPDYQGIDQSKLVPLLTAALQEALTEIADLKARVTALEAV